MEVSTSTVIHGTAADVWQVVADIDGAAARISGIKSIEVLEPAVDETLVGLKWRETREWMGKEAVEVMWVVDGKLHEFYQTRAESHGAIYTSTLQLKPVSEGTELTMTFEGVPVTLFAKIMWLLTGWMAKKAVCTAFDQDLADIKAAVEQAS